MNQENIRNFSIIAHIDHGKSTLADRLLELTGTIQGNPSASSGQGKMQEQFLDSMELERERGITIKLKPVRMIYRPRPSTNNELVANKRINEFVNSKIRTDSLSVDGYILNLVDTPGHVDFSYEVSRALAAVEGAVLLVDATQGIQAQTLANVELAKQQNLVIIPVVNKIDSASANIEESVEELANLLTVPKEEVIKISAKNGTNVEQVLKAIVEKVLPPQSMRPTRPGLVESLPPQSMRPTRPGLVESFRALIFDSVFDAFKGVVAYVRVFEGEIKSKEKIELMAAKIKGEVKELGYFNPKMVTQEKLSAGEIGYIATGIKEPGKVRVGDTITKVAGVGAPQLSPLAGYKEPNPMVFASFYPENPDDFDLLKVALSKLKLQDPSLVFEPEMKEALGRGFRCGFLGTLHVEIISERLQREFGLGLVISTPSVIYKIFDKQGKESLIYSASDWPSQSAIESSEEPWVQLEVITPSSYIGRLMDVLKDLRGNYLKTDYISADRAVIIYEVPLRAVVANLYDKIKSISQGYASMNYKLSGYRPAKLAKLEILIAGRPEEALSKVVAVDDAYQEGKKMVEKLKETLPPQQFSVALQAAIGGKIIARETISARRKDVTGYLYGGDVSRKKKLLQKQKKGKKLLKEKGRVNIPSKTFLEIFRS